MLTTIPASRQTKPAFLYGGESIGESSPACPSFADHVSSHLALRLQYRGLLYKAPDFKVQNLFTGDRGHMAEPTIGVVVRF